MYKAKRNELPENLMNLFEIKNNINYNLRSNGNEFTLQKSKTNFMKKALAIMVLKHGIIYRDV
jgi:hypothetical protein